VLVFVTAATMSVPASAAFRPGTRHN